MEINLYLIDICHSGNTSGVDRYLKTLIRGLKNYPEIRIHQIRLVDDRRLLFVQKEESENYIKYTVPFPQISAIIINNRACMTEYNKIVYNKIKHLFHGKKNKIIHSHTLNLIDLALYLKEKEGGKVITHLHCIPWKGLYNSATDRFNELYQKIYIEKEHVIKEDLVTHKQEIDSYNLPDHVICVTENAKHFLTEYMGTDENSISVIPNGIDDLMGEYSGRKGDKTIELLYAGFVSKSKGLEYILRAMKMVKARGYNVSLTVAGSCPQMTKQYLLDEYKDLQVKILGLIPFDELKFYYQQCDVGVIASLQEQSSYVAIEMAMFGMPLITTAVDGLDEMFTDEVNALKVGTTFTREKGLDVDEEMLANKIINMIESPQKRKLLGKNIRQQYEKYFQLARMMEETVSVYKQLLKKQ